MARLSSETHLTRLVNLDWLIQRNAVLLAMAHIKIGAGSPQDALNDVELIRYTGLVDFQARLIYERSMLRSYLVGGPFLETTPALYASVSVIEN